MLRCLQWTITVVAVACFTGCGDSAESLLKQQIADMNALADGLEAGKTEKDIKPIADRMKANSEKLDKMKVSDAEKKRLAEKYQEPLKTATMRMVTASMKSGGAGVETLMKGIGGVTTPD